MSTDIAKLQVGDQILLANGCDLTQVDNQTAVSALSATAAVDLVVSRTGRVPDWKLNRERVLW